MQSSDLNPNLNRGSPTASGTSYPRPPLFRLEVLAAQSQHSLGSIRIAALPGAGAMASLALVLVGLLVAFAVWGQATGKAQVAGLLVPPGGVMQLTTPQACRLVQVLVAEGQKVQPGALLAVVDVAVHSDQGNTAALLAQSLQARSAHCSPPGTATRAGPS